MQHFIRHGPNHASLDFVLNEDEIIQAEIDVMIAMSPDIEVSLSAVSQANSRWWGSARSVAIGENVPTANFVAKKDGATLSLAPRTLGSILHLPLTGETNYCIAHGNFLANTPEVLTAYKHVGFQGVIAKMGLQVIFAEGVGDLFCASYGAIVRRILNDEESILIDNRCLIAFSDITRLELVRISKDSMGGNFPGGGLVNQFTGPGTVIYQTRARQIVAPMQ